MSGRKVEEEDRNHAAAILRGGERDATITFRATSNKGLVLQGTPSTPQDDLTKIVHESASYKNLKVKEVVTHSRAPGPCQPTSSPCLVPAASGLTSMLVDAYNKHQAVTLDPNDVWIAFLVQVGFYVNGRAEALRDKLVGFPGKKELVVVGDGGLKTADYVGLTQSMAEAIQGAIRDPDMADLLVPDWSTTTETHRMAARIALMSSMQSYFQYKYSLRCGIPEVTLKGTVEDWVDMQTRAKKVVALFGIADADGVNHLQVWGDSIDQMMGYMAESRKGNPSLTFWDTVAHRSGGGSGPTYLSGWVTLFSYFTVSGNVNDTCAPSCRDRYGFTQLTGKSKAPDLLFFAPVIDTQDLQPGTISVPIVVEDKMENVEYPCQLVAGNLVSDVVGMAGDPALISHVSSATDWYLGVTSVRET